MGFWRFVLEGLAASLRGSSGDAKVQIRAPGETIWRDYTFVASNPESVQGAIHLAASAYPGHSVRVIDSRGSTIDFR